MNPVQYLNQFTEIRPMKSKTQKWEILTQSEDWCWWAVEEREVLGLIQVRPSGWWVGDASMPLEDESQGLRVPEEGGLAATGLWRMSILRSCTAWELAWEGEEVGGGVAELREVGREGGGGVTSGWVLFFFLIFFNQMIQT